MFTDFFDINNRINETKNNISVIPNILRQNQIKIKNIVPFKTKYDIILAKSYETDNIESILKDYNFIYDKNNRIITIFY